MTRRAAAAAGALLVLAAFILMGIYQPPPFDYRYTPRYCTYIQAVGGDTIRFPNPDYGVNSWASGVGAGGDSSITVRWISASRMAGTGISLLTIWSDRCPAGSVIVRIGQSLSSEPPDEIVWPNVSKLYYNDANTDSLVVQAIDY